MPCGVVGLEPVLEPAFEFECECECWEEEVCEREKSKEERDSEFEPLGSDGGVRSKKKPRGLPPGSITKGGVLTRLML